MFLPRRRFSAPLLTAALLSALALAPVLCDSSPALAANPPPAAAQPPTVNQVIDRVQAFYDQTQVFQAAFKQKFTMAVHNKVKHSQGTVTFEKPGKMSWRYSNNGNRVVSDGKIVKVYEADNKQMFVQKVETSQYPAALSFLLGSGKLKDEFRFRLLDANKMKFEGGYVLEGEPKAPNPSFQRMLLYVDSGTAHVRRVLIIDAQGNQNRFDFLEPVVNVSVPPAEFNFTPPTGTQIIKP